MLNIAIDGPSGAGKSTIAKKLAKKLNILYLDTGAMYRALGLKAKKLNIDPNDVKNVESFLNTTNIEIIYKNQEQKIFLDGEDVSTTIREHIISKYASDISKHKKVREKLVKMQREIASKQDSVLDGRDIGSFVLPTSKNKFYLTASSEVRADRRCKELQAKGENVDYNKILQDIIDRDKNDMEREFAPLVQCKDATLIDSSNLSIDEVVEVLIKNLKK